jgi:hypothetical protein
MTYQIFVNGISSKTQTRRNFSVPTMKGSIGCKMNFSPILIYGEHHARLAKGP